MSPQIEKQQFRNNTDGYIGVVQLSVKGEELGAPVEPGGTVWLSEAEQILTANAPRDPADNPFIPHKMQRRNPETDALEDVEITPLVPISENRYVPASERPIPSDLAAADASAEAAAAASADEPTTPVPAEAGEDEEAPAALHERAVVEAGKDTAPGAVPPPPPAAAAAAAAAAAEDAPEAPSEPQEAAGPPAPTAPLPPGADASIQAPEDEGRVPQSEAVEEETAAVSPGPAHEETGAALPPTGEAPEGHYTAGEEVGTPQAPTSGDEAASDISAPAPAPLTED